MTLVKKNRLRGWKIGLIVALVFYAFGLLISISGFVETLQYTDYNWTQALHDYSGEIGYEQGVINILFDNSGGGQLILSILGMPLTFLLAPLIRALGNLINPDIILQAASTWISFIINTILIGIIIEWIIIKIKSKNNKN